LEVRLKAVKLYVEERLPSALICGELKVSRKQVYEWGVPGTHDLSPILGSSRDTRLVSNTRET
jgi:hypothetical protein